jgi:hypothetical protein
VVNHQKLVCRLSGGLCEVADILPRAELILQLYPTPHVRRTIVSLYAHIVRFLIRALRWYKDSTTRHMIHAITRPVELRYDDLLDLITVQARGLTELASASSHAEQRDMHSTIQRQTRYHKETQKSIEQLTALVLQMKEAMATEHVINASARIELRQRLSEMQLVQFMEQISVDVLPEPIKSFQASLFMRGRSRLGPSTKSPSFWLDPKIQWWNQSRDSSLIIIKGTWKLRLHLRGFCADIIASLQGNSVPVIWALNSIDFVQTSVKDAVSSVELIKYLIAQVVLINTTVHVDAALVPGLGMYMSARTASEWMNVLASLLSGIPRLYMVIDVEVLHPSAAASSQNFWSSAFHDIFADLRARQIETVLKVVMVSYGSPLLGEMYDTKWRHIVVSVGGARKSKALNNRRPKALGKKTLNLVRRSRGPQRFNSIKFGLCLDL